MDGKNIAIVILSISTFVLLLTTILLGLSNIGLYTMLEEDEQYIGVMDDLNEEYAIVLDKCLTYLDDEEYSELLFGEDYIQGEL